MKKETHKLFCRIPVPMYQKLKKEAEKRGLPVVALIILLLEEKLNIGK